MSIDPTTQAIITLLHAVTDMPVIAHTSLQLHDRDGSILKALRLWARANDHTIRHHVLTNPDDHITWDCFEVVGSWGTVDVHDHRSERRADAAQDSTTSAVWSVGQHSAECGL